MNQQYEYSIVISPNLRFKQKKDSFIVVNEYNGNKVRFKNNSVEQLLKYFDKPRKISDALKVMDGKTRENEEIIKKLVEWDFLIVDLGLSERNCPLCQSNDNSLLVEHQNDYYQRKFKYVKCNNCGLVFLNPAPNEKALNFFYSFKNYYSVIPINSKQKFEKKLELKSNMLRTSILLEYYKLNENTKILDVGSGTGNFASYLNKTFGCDVTCIDKDPQALNYIEKNFPEIKTLNGDFKNANIDTKFDVITMWGYIEHEFDPVITLKKASELLVTEGLLVIDAPNIEGKLAHKSLKDWPYLHSPYHICHFSPNTLSSLAKKTGFNPIELIYRKTGAYLLKYSETVLHILYKYNLFFSSGLLDRLTYYISKIFMPFESKYDNRFITILKKL